MDDDDRAKGKQTGGSIELLPIEVFAQIVSYLDHKMRKKLRLVFPEFTAVLDNYFFRFHGILTDTTFPFILNTKINLESVTVQNFLFRPKTNGKIPKYVPHNPTNADDHSDNDDDDNGNNNYHDESEYGGDERVKVKIKTGVQVNQKISDEKQNKVNMNQYKISTRKLIFKQQESMPNRCPAGFNFISFRTQTPSVSDENISFLIKANQNSLESLSFQRNSLKYIKPSSLMKMMKITENKVVLNKLKDFEISLADDPTKKEKQILSGFAKFGSGIEMPVLKRLSFQLCFSLIEDQWENLEFYVRIFNWIANLKNTLQILDFKYDFILFPSPDSLLFYLENGEENNLGRRTDSLNLDQRKLHEVLAKEKFQNVKNKLIDLQLDELSIALPKYEGYAPYTFGTLLVGNQTHLTSLTVTILNDDSQHLYTIIGRCIRQNSLTLKRISLNNKCLFRTQSLPSSTVSNAIGQCSCNQLEFLSLVGFHIYTLVDTFNMIPEDTSTMLKMAKAKYKLKQLELIGTLHPRIILEIMTLLPTLEVLKFWYNSSVDPNHHEFLEANLSAFLNKMTNRKSGDADGDRHLKVVKWLVGGLNMDFLLDIPGIRIQGNRNGLHECRITVLRRRND